MCVKLCQNFRGTIRKHIYLYVTKTFSVATLTLFCSFRMEQKKTTFGSYRKTQRLSLIDLIIDTQGMAQNFSKPPSMKG